MPSNRATAELRLSQLGAVESLKRITHVLQELPVEEFAGIDEAVRDPIARLLLTVHGAQTSQPDPRPSKVVVILEADDQQLVYDNATLAEEPSTIAVRRGTSSIARFSKRDVKRWYTEP
jgi:hypothetical protein